MSGFFGFNTALPERQQAAPQGNQGGFGGFAGGRNGGNDGTAFSLGGAGEEEDLAVYNWGDQTGSLMEDGDGMNDDTFGDIGEIQNNFNFSSQPSAPVSKPKTQGRGNVASTESRYKPKVAADPFAFSENDFYSPRRPASRPSKPPAPVPMNRPSPAPRTQSYTTPEPQPQSFTAPAPASSIEQLWGNPVAPTQTLWGASPASSTRPSGPAAQNAPNTTTQPPPVGQMKTLAEIEEEMSRMAIPEPPRQHQMLSMDEIERQMMASMEAPPVHRTPVPMPPPMVQPPREATPPQINLAGSGYASQQALLDSIFPQLGATPAPGTTTASFPGAENAPPRQSPEEQARLHALHERIKGKIESMSHHNHLMGNSDKDFITRIQLSQLVTADPYASDFYAQVFSALRRRQEAALAQPSQEGDGPTVVQVTAGAAFGVSAPANRFGKMGTATMSKLTGQVKKIVENRMNQQRTSNTAALQGALGKVSRGGVAAPRPVLAVPTTGNKDHRPTAILNDQSGIRRSALTKKQVLFALEELYDSVLELEQMRREMPPMEAIDEIQEWNQRCEMKVEEIWRRLMVMEPLDVSNPHPFISLMNALKGQRLFPRLLRHLPHQQALTLLTLIIATYPQLDVVAKAPPPPVADSSLLTKADRMDRARREAETDSFLHCVVPGLDILIQRCGLGLVAGLMGIVAQRMEVWRVACTRPGVALLTALLSRAQSVIRPDPTNPQAAPPPDAGELDQWNKIYAYFLSILLPHLSDLFPSSSVQRNAFGPGAYLITTNDSSDEMERRDAEVWGFTAALAVNAPEEEQANLVGALREKILHTVQSSRAPGVSPEGRDRKLRNVNMFLHGLGLDASMIE